MASLASPPRDAKAEVRYFARDPPAEALDKNGKHTFGTAKENSTPEGFKAARHRAEAFRLESLAHLSRLPGRGAQTEQFLRAATDSYVWAETWIRLAARSEPHAEDAVDAWASTVRELSASLEAEPTSPAPPGACGEHETRARPEDRGWLRRRYDRHRAIAPTGGTIRIGTVTFLHVAWSWVPRLVDLVGSGPRSARAIAWCAICRTEYELPSATNPLATRCAGCGTKLIPHEPERFRFGEPRARRGACPHCAAPVGHLERGRHTRCTGCGTAITGVRTENGA